MPLPAGNELIAGSGDACALRLRGAGMPARLAAVYRGDADIWLRVLAGDPPVGVNGRPIRSLARALPGDRVCFGAFCVDLLGDPLADRSRSAPVAGFALRTRGGVGSGELHSGPTLYLNTDGEIVSAAAGAISLSLADGEIWLEPDAAAVKVNGHPVNAALRIIGGDQIQVGARRYLVEAVTTAVEEAVTQRLPAVASIGAQEPPAPREENGGLWWLIGIAALIASAVAALLYFHD